MNDTDQLAQALFEADEFTEILYIYNKYGVKLKWETAPASIQNKYITRAQKVITEQNENTDLSNTAAIF